MVSLLPCLVYICVIMILLFSVSFSDSNLIPSGIHSPKKDRFPIIYVYIVVSSVCSKGLPGYIKDSLEHTVLTQVDCDVILASNYGTCPKISEIVDTIAGVIKVDVDKIMSERTRLFKNTSENILVSDGGSELWLTSAHRFFYMEDIMNHYQYKEMLHVEADNLLYGRITSLLPVLRSQFPGLTATPLHYTLLFITASVFWISDVEYLHHFNTFLSNTSMVPGQYWNDYTDWLKLSAKTKGGHNQDANGWGVPIFAVNEMSLLAYYHHLYPDRFKLLPVLKEYPYFTNRHTRNLNWWKPTGAKTGGFTGDGIWDPNSWGQLIGGTSRKGGRDKGFTDTIHIIGQAIRSNKCQTRMLCSNSTWFTHFNDSLTSTDGSKGTTMCLTAPFVSCAEYWRLPGSNRTREDLAEDSGWTPLWNLHVHSKHTADYRSRECACRAEHYSLEPNPSILAV